MGPKLNSSHEDNRFKPCNWTLKRTGVEYRIPMTQNCFDLGTKGNHRDLGVLKGITQERDRLS